MELIAGIFIGALGGSLVTACFAGAKIVNISYDRPADSVEALLKAEEERELDEWAKRMVKDIEEEG